ncbi:MAG: class I SAM-dependent methyltransferase [Alphaproteobacteria bacterium]|nr:class I SAM-dependent methyltransferase [Alphaproteobacteria bacterium]
MPDSKQKVADLYEHLLGRRPGQKELAEWTSALQESGFESLFYRFIASPEYARRRRVSSLFPAGHFHSAVVDPDIVREYVEWSASQPIAAIDLPIDAMTTFYARHLNLLRSTTFSAGPGLAQRYYMDGSPFPYGDALVLRAMLVEHRPRNIIEIGSGFSTAAMLDAADEFNLDFRITCIEPYPDRLNALLRPQDRDRISIIETDLQKVPLDVFGAMGPGDIVFIDSTHVMKTGSDVHYELFHILPALRQGTIVHIHDIHAPFEYPPKWIYEDNYSWNEIYAVRAFLMYNHRFRVVCWNSLFVQKRKDWLLKYFPEMLSRNPGGSIWLEVGGQE